MTKVAKRDFLDLVDQVNSSANGVRVVGRLRMSVFIEKYGKAQCDEFYAAYSAKLKEKTK